MTSPGHNARKTVHLFGGLVHVTFSASGVSESIGCDRCRFNVNSKGRARPSVNFGHGFRWTRSRKL